MVPGKPLRERSLPTGIKVGISGPLAEGPPPVPSSLKCHVQEVADMSVAPRQDCLQVGPLGHVVGEADADPPKLPLEMLDLPVQFLDLGHDAPLKGRPGLGYEAAHAHREFRQAFRIAALLQDAVRGRLGKPWTRWEEHTSEVESL